MSSLERMIFEEIVHYVNCVDSMGGGFGGIA